LPYIHLDIDNSDLTNSKQFICQCDHNDSSVYVERDSSSYYNEEYFSKKLYPDTTCADCKILFGINYKVTVNSKVYTCTKAADTYCECVHALCQKCYVDRFIRGYTENSGIKTNVRIRGSK
jgi:hypothetical protein